jgi:TetR/AcrR family fatty acid metabolism transcriptional regulator
MRDVILGTLDAETISSLAMGEIESGESDFEAVVDLVDAMVAAEAEVDGRRASRLDAIMSAAKQVFAERDFGKATISEIARLAGVADATIYEYFQSKEDILLSLATRQIDSYFGEGAEVFEIKSPLRKLNRLIRYYFARLLSDREFLKVFLMRLLSNDQFYASKAFEGIKTYGRLIQEVIEEGKAQAIFRPSVDARVFRNMFFGAFSHIAVRWVVLREVIEVDAMHEIDQVTGLLISAVKAGQSHE